jgi:predicted nucleic acid-binding protein
MRVFIDTSSLFKKYIEENGSKKLEELLGSVSEIIIAPITILEVNSILERRLKEKSINSLDAKWIEKEFLLDYDYFGIIEFNDDLVRECIRVVRRYQLKVLDGIQLSSAIFSRPQLFIVSDLRLFEAAKKEMPLVEFVG